MRKYTTITILLIFHQLYALGQPGLFSREIRTPRPNSFYSAEHYKHDRAKIYNDQKNSLPTSLPLIPANSQNSNNQIATNLENPDGTLVVDSSISLDDLEHLLHDPSKISFKRKDFVEIAFTKDKVTYTIPLVNETRLDLSESIVINEYMDAIENCIEIKKVVPGSAKLSNDNFANCSFLAFRSSSFTQQYYSQRLNLSCVFIFSNNINYLAYVVK